jgi:hypothetical protein
LSCDSDAVVRVLVHAAIEQSPAHAAGPLPVVHKPICVAGFLFHRSLGSLNGNHDLPECGHDTGQELVYPVQVPGRGFQPFIGVAAVDSSCTARTVTAEF